MLYEEVERGEVLDRFSCPTNLRDNNLDLEEITKYLDINCSRNLAIYKNDFDDYEKDKHKIGGQSRIPHFFHGDIPSTFLDISQFIKEDFRASFVIIPKTSNNEIKKDNKWVKMFSDTNSQFVCYTYLRFSIERFMSPLRKSGYNYKEAFLNFLINPHLLSYMIFLDNLIFHDPSIREKLYKFLKEEFDDTE